MTTPKTVDDLAALTNGIPLVGYVVSATIDNVNLSRLELERRLAKYDLDRFMPEEITARTALRRALVALLQHKAKAGGTKVGWGDMHADENGASTVAEKLIVPPPLNTPTHLVFMIQLQRADAKNISIDFQTTLRVSLAKGTHTIFCAWTRQGKMDAGSEDLTFARELQPFWDAAQETYTNADISALVYKAVRDCASVSIRRDGGLHFVPDGEQRQLFHIRDFVNGLRVGTTPDAVAYCIALGVPDRPQDRTNLAAAAHQGLMDEVARLTTDMERMIASKPGTLKQSTVDRRLAEYNDVRRRAQTYHDLLGLKAESVLERLTKMRKITNDLMDRPVADDDDTGVELDHYADPE